MSEREVMAEVVKSLKAAQAKMDALLVQGMGKPGRPAFGEDPGEDTVQPRPQLVDKASRARVAIADAITAVQAAYAENGVRPS